ncbi:hypothetical protein QVD17_33010 [Tagetes erecta]|uniref:Uncharacterized protein n=1 Tax=Tagetes erecta TaxID=13708 RepID=A0AAD8NJM1_TARER|nr:hypothetical protein QVD17_33010 [Tagetes erecta]
MLITFSPKSVKKDSLPIQKSHPKKNQFCFFESIFKIKSCSFSPIRNPDPSAQVLHSILHVLVCSYHLGLLNNSIFVN